MLPAFQQVILSSYIIRRSRNHHSLTFQTPAARTDIYKGSFFPKPIGLECPFRFFLLPLLKGAEDGVGRFTSLVRASDLLPISQVLVIECH